MATTLPAQCQLAWTPAESTPGVNAGFVAATCNWDPDGPGALPPVVVVGGVFYAAGNTLANNIATYDPVTRQFAALGTGTNGPVHALTVGPNNELIAGGSFGLAGGTPCTRIARWNGATWQPLGQGMFTPGLPSFGHVAALATLPNGDVVALGNFSNAGTAVANNVARWDGFTWSAMGSGLGTTGSTLLVRQSGELIAGGGQLFNASNVARWTGTAWDGMARVLLQVTPFNVAGSVDALASLPNGDLIVGGQFIRLDSGGTAIPAANIARWNGTTWSTLGVGVPSAVSALHVRSNGELLIGGGFNLAGGLASTGVATWSNGTWGVFGSGNNPPNVDDLIELANGDVLAAGNFHTGGPNPGLSRLRRWNGSAWGETNPAGVNDRIDTITRLRNGEVVITGAFTSANGVPLPGLARGTIGNWQAFAPGLNGPVYAVVEMPNGDLVVGGAFTSAGTTPANNIARWNGSAWLPLGSGCDSWVTQLSAHPNGDVVASGSFTSAGGVPASHIARWNGAAWQALGGGLPSPECRHAVAANGDLLATFAVLGSSWYTASFWRWNGATWQPFATDLDGAVASMTILPTGELLAAGQLIQGPASGVFRWDGIAWQPYGTGVLGSVNAALPLPGGKLLVAGSVNGGDCVMEWNGASWTQAPINTFNGLPSAQSLALLLDGSVLVVGQFATVGSATTSNIARAAPTCPAATTALGTGCPGTSGNHTLVGDLAWVGSTWRAQATGLPAPSLVLLVFGLNVANVPLATLLPAAGPSCTLRPSNDFLDFTISTAGTAEAQLVIPPTTAIVGSTLHHQMLPLEFNAQGAISSASVTPAISVTIGAY